ncbi:CDP-alcohol phosphatidyltransferase family protein [Engelhardtia mirabilis]|uniref:CDP-alcohol phosphatidyltransferase n=1 Tax=Engelhardtia mirabilis TaxID=2528011 RepID=A0A518BMQ4_9BACT|nr:CDP-alcohol phosphatidyltransferase [Planctomycetes bacterium Pla133]QDV02549.1 CDP-alcohol phosphatidyltransferase [Planctomycetes bacterium Pla86]
MRKVHLLPNLLTLGNAFCGLLALAKGIDALAYAGDGGVFYAKMQTACSLVFLGMVFDLLDGWVARLTRSESPFGAQLDSYSDALTFGVAPALLAKVLIEHEGALGGWPGNPRLHFLAAAAFALMAILRLVRFNLETDDEVKQKHAVFFGLPSPAAAGSVVSTIWVYLVLQRPELETVDGTPTPLGGVMGWLGEHDWNVLSAVIPLMLLVQLPILGLLMVSRVRYSHLGHLLGRERSSFVTLVVAVFAAFGFFLVPVPSLFLLFNGFVVWGLVNYGLRGRRLARARSDEARGRVA